MDPVASAFERCPQAETLAGLAAGELSEDVATEVRAHLDECESCAIAVARLVRAPPSAPPPAVTRGTAVGRYEIRDVVGLGAMGVVYLAFDPELQRDVAIKLLRPSADTSPILVERLRRESRALARLRDPNVTAIYDVGEFAGQVFIAMEYVEGTTLRRWLERKPRRTREILAVFAQAASGLAAAHRAGFVHRDFKPDNVLVDLAGRALVSDFGLARPVDETFGADAAEHSRGGVTDGALTLTASGARVGTPLYMAPEQIDGGEVGPAADQFAFAVALYEALYQQRPFAGDTVLGLFASVGAGKLRPPPQGSRVPPHVFAALRRALAVQPKDRFGDITALVEALGRDRRSRRATVVAAATLGVFVGVFAWGWQRRRDAAVQACNDLAASAAWTSEARADVDAALGAVAPFGHAVFERVAPRLDAYATAVGDAEASVCIAATVQRSLDAHGAELRIACLDQRRGALADVVERLRVADARVLARVGQLVGELPPVAECDDPTWLRRHIAPMLASPDAAAIAAARTEIAGVRTAYNAGLYDEADTRLVSLAPTITALADAPLQAEFALERGLVTHARGDYARAQVELEAAFHLGWRTGEDERAARAAVDLVDLLGRMRDDPAGAERWAALAATAIARLDPPRIDLEILRLRNLGLVANAARHFGAAAAYYEVALVLTRRDLGDTHPFVSSLWNNIAANDMAGGDYHRGIVAFRSVIAARETDLGPNHPGLVPPLINLGNALRVTGDFRGALEAYARAEQICVAQGDAGRHQLGALSANRAAIHVAFGDTDAALADTRRALEVDRERLPPSHAIIVEDLAIVARVALDRHDVALAREHLDQANAAVAGLAPDDPIRGHLAIENGRLALAQGDVEAALRHLGTAVSQGRSGPDIRDRAERELAAALLQGGRREEALAAYERALAEAPPDDPLAVIPSLEALAAALGPDQAARAAELYGRADRLRREHGLPPRTP